MQIKIDPHTIERANERGSNEEEIKDVIKTGFPVSAKYGYYGKAKICDFNRKRHGTYYIQKRVEVFYVIERDIIVTVTVYVFYGMEFQKAIPTTETSQGTQRVLSSPTLLADEVSCGKWEGKK